MQNTQRLSETWYRRGLWLVAVALAAFLTGLGGAVMRDLPKVEPVRDLRSYMDGPKADLLRDRARASKKATEGAVAALEEARQQQRVAIADTESAAASLQSWLATRQATQLATQDPEVLSRTRSVEGLRLAERNALGVVLRQESAVQVARRGTAALERELEEMERVAMNAQEADERRIELRVFLARLAVTLPLLVVAIVGLRSWRKTTAWPFVWGFALFALFTFFVELVPYLPSYGGYVRNTVGVVLTVVVGRWAITGLNAWLEKQRAAEALPDVKRRHALMYDTALARIGKGVCPGCERPVDMKDGRLDFCPHCGIGLNDLCRRCGTRKNAFARYCTSCGEAAMESATGPAPGTSPASALSDTGPLTGTGSDALPGAAAPA